MAALLALTRLIDRINELVGKWVSWLVLAAVLVSSINAVVRKAFNISSNGWLELQWYLFSAVVMLAAAWALKNGDHVKIDLIYNRLGRKAQVVVDLLGTAFFLLPFAYISMKLTYAAFLDKYISGETSANAGGLILWPVWLILPIGFALLSLQGLSEIIKRLAFLSGAGPDPSAGDEQPTH